ncbi:hypothetical protein NDI52_33875 [Leptolyngbya sp. PL-A3]|uniref:hypothetical protein n=1 Tax=Leptolyngbya sp. PL-A3 TaxID=2933911 RepID=UPI003297BD9A
MLSEKFIVELGIALQAQNHLLRKLASATSEIGSKLTNIEQKLSDTGVASEQLQALEKLMSDLEASQDWLEVEDFENFNVDQILGLYKQRQKHISVELIKIGFNDWESFVRQCQAYTLSQGIDPLAPYEALLTEADFEVLKEESFNAQFRWDKWDYIFVGASGILASLTDYFLVKIPTTLTTGQYAGQTSSPITEWIKKYDTTRGDDWFASWAQNLAETCKVPYDSMSYVDADSIKRITGIFPKSHRLQSLGHDPVLGFIFGVLDIMRGTITGFSYDRLTHSHTWLQGAVWSNLEPINLIEAILRQIGHLISDVATPMGLPAPFMTLIQGINVGSFGKGRHTIGELARWMYLNGYDFRHFLVSGITPAVIEIFLRAYIMLRHYAEHGEQRVNLTSHPKYRTMLLLAHGIATAGNAGKITLMQGNPLAINYAEWMAFIRYLMPSMKYWLFDQYQLKIEHLENINTNEWEQLLKSSDDILAAVTALDYPTVTLGKL